MNSETNSEMALRYCCAIRPISWNRLVNKLGLPAYYQLICSSHPIPVLHGHLVDGQNKAIIRRPNSALLRKETISAMNSEMTSHYHCAIEPV